MEIINFILFFKFTKFLFNLTGRFASEACTSSSQCLENAQCIGLLCTCVPDYYFSDQVGQCLQLKNYSVTCLDTRECRTSAYLSCSRRLYESQCLCPSAYYYGNLTGNYECLPHRAIGEICSSSSDCSSTSYCAWTGNDYRCLCQNGTYVDSKPFFICISIIHGFDLLNET